VKFVGYESIVTKKTKKIKLYLTEKVLYIKFVCQMLRMYHTYKVLGIYIKHNTKVLK